MRQKDSKHSNIEINVVERNRKQMSVARCASSSDNSYCTQSVDTKWERAAHSAHTLYGRKIIFKTLCSIVCRLHFQFMCALCSQIVAKCICANIHVAESRTTAMALNELCIYALQIRSTFKITCIYFVKIFFAIVFIVAFIRMHQDDKRSWQRPGATFSVRFFRFCQFFFARSNTRTIRKDNMIQSEMRKKPWKSETNEIAMHKRSHAFQL